jgi:C-methyltransferase C-terminal domain
LELKHQQQHSIISEKESRALNPDYCLVLPWHLADEFLERERETILNGTAMIFPLPQIKMINRISLSKSV